MREWAAIYWLACYAILIDHVYRHKKQITLLAHIFLFLFAPLFGPAIIVCLIYNIVKELKS